MSHHDDAGEDALAGIDLHKWQVPPPPAEQRPTILVRALTPPVSKRRHVGWAIAAMLALNAAIVTIIAIIIVRPPNVTTVSVRPAGPAFDEHTRELLRQLDEQQREIDRRLAELEELQKLIEQLSEKLRTVEEREKRLRPVPKPREALPSPTGCDEVSCVLDNYQPACCARFVQTPGDRIPASINTVPESLDRQMISSGMAAVRARIAVCGDRSPAKGKVKARIQVNAAGKVIRIAIVQTPDAPLGACVASAIRGATFGKTQNGGSFSYPFVF